MAEGRLRGSSSATEGVAAAEPSGALGERRDVKPPATFPAGTRDELSTVPPSAPIARANALLRAAPSARESASAIAAAMYHSTELPKLNVETNDDVANTRVPRVSKQLRNRLLLALMMLPLLGATAVVLYMELAG